MLLVPTTTTVTAAASVPFSLTSTNALCSTSCTKSMLERANDLKRLEQALRPPKARGGFGELLLANLLADMLPASAYTLQHGFASGERVEGGIEHVTLEPDRHLGA